MKLLYITNGITGAGGLERVLSVKTSLLTERFGYEVHILCLNEKGKVPFFPFSQQVIFHVVDVMGDTFSYITKYRSGVQRVVFEVEPSVICVCDDALKGFFLPFIIKTDAKWVYESHASIFLGNAGNGISIAKKWQHQLKLILGRRFSTIVLLTESNKKEWKLPNTTVIPNPLPFQTENVSSLDSKRVIAVGSYSFNKGYDLLLKVWQQLQADFPDWELNIYGKGVPGNLKSDIEKIGLKGINCHGPVKDIQERYLESAVFVLPSRSEGFGMVIIEAMSCGLPVVSFDCPHGPGDIISNEKDGFLVEDSNTDIFAKKLELLMQNEKLRRQVGSCGQQTSKKYSPERIVQQWCILFKNL